MNTIKSLVRRISLTVTVLVAALWLPTTTFALDLSVGNGSAEGVISQVGDCQYDSSHDSSDWFQVEKIGFGETDLVSQQSQHSPTSNPAFESRVSQTVLGFAETDPAHPQSWYAVNFFQASNQPIQQQFVGFAETDPASDSYVFGNENDSRSVVTCHGGSSKHVVLEATPS